MDGALEQVPTTFHDSLVLRAKSLRFRGIGNPYAFLSEIGLVPIKEFIYRGATIIDLSEALNLPVTVLRNWIEENGYAGDIEEASTLSAEGYIRKGEQALKIARDKFELDKAKAMIEHGRWMASRKDKRTYGTQVGELGGPAAVSYVFNVNSTAPVQVNTAPTVDPKRMVQAEEKPPVAFHPLSSAPFLQDTTPEYIKKMRNVPLVGPVELPKADHVIEGDKE